MKQQRFRLVPRLLFFTVDSQQNAMKITLFLLILLVLTAAAFGQTASVLSSEVRINPVPDHPQHASQHSMADEHPLVGGGPGTYTYAQGERPLWEFGPVTEPVPLGDVARAYRKEKLAAKKAQIVFEKQGS
jgi:hypothetical protein